MQADRLISNLRKLFGYKFPGLGPAFFNLILKTLPRRVEIEMFPKLGIAMDLEDLTMKSTFWQGDRFEKPTAQILGAWAARGAVHFFDIGSNYGFFSYYLLSRSPLIQVDAFEPNPATNDKVRLTIKKNNLLRMRVHQIGLSNVSDALELHPGVEDSGHSTFGSHPGLAVAGNEKIPVRPFDRWRKEARIPLPARPEWIAKIDVEGFEVKALQGMKEALDARAFIGLAVEINEYTLNFCGHLPREIHDTMELHGYELMCQREPSCWDYGRTANAFFVPKD